MSAFGDIYEEIRERFEEAIADDPQCKRLIKKVQRGQASYLDAHEYAVRVGMNASKTLVEKLCDDNGLLPTEMSQELIESYRTIVTGIMEDSFGLSADYARMVQENANKAANIGLKAQEAELDVERCTTLAERVATEGRGAEWLLDEPIINHSQHAVDATIEANAKQHSKFGLKPKMVRIYDASEVCEWCEALAGEYYYGEQPPDFFRRHDRCRCNIDYMTASGKTKVWSTEVVGSERTYVKKTSKKGGSYYARTK